MMQDQALCDKVLMAAFWEAPLSVRNCGVVEFRGVSGALTSALMLTWTSRYATKGAQKASILHTVWGEGRGFAGQG